jgi:putative glycosyltransferase (TIGR04372 family)
MRGKIKRLLSIPHKLLLLILVLPIVAVVRLIRPWFLVRWGVLPSPRIGHFAANTELYLCERDVGINLPRQPHIDRFFMEQQVCNEQLAKMWKRVLRICPAWWLVPSLQRANRLIPGGAVHEIGENTQGDRDVHNLLDRFPPHLKFSAEEEVRGEDGLRVMGIPAGAPFVCLIVRDAAYLDAHQSKDWTYHNYRDSDIQNYLLAAEELADRGYFVVRMGAKVHEAIKSSNPKIIDYATNGMRSDFMDVYLGERCEFCVSSGTGFDALPYIFRRPIVYANLVPLGYLWTFRQKIIGITKHHIPLQKDRDLTLSEIFTQGVGFGLRTSDYETQGVRLVENTPEEIRDVVVEMAERLNGTWQPGTNDDALQRRFWEIYLVHAKDIYQNKPLHGETRARFGAQFLRDNSAFLS